MTETPEESIRSEEEQAPPTEQEEAATEETPESDSEVLDRKLKEAGNEAAPWSRGEALANSEAEEIAAERRATVVVLAGGTGSGKTTLLASLYERFGRGPVAAHLFDGSRTLHGLELRCHRSIYGSGPGGGDQGHTALGALPWLHLRLRRDERTIELLMGDYSGEHFEALASGSEKPIEYPQLRRADHIGIVVNGGALADPPKAMAEQREALELVRALLSEPDAYAGPGSLTVIVTKWDLVLRGGERAREAFEKARQMISSEISARYPDASVGYIETAARSTVKELPLGHGIDDLLLRWTDVPAVSIANPPDGVKYHPAGISSFKAEE
ncbi:MAG TPA: hypothetical protein VFT79_05285 [Solirubrobacterales bacterium]|nr:hypothetical protein [Solirubrobacterales bacterium]